MQTVHGNNNEDGLQRSKNWEFGILLLSSLIAEKISFLGGFTDSTEEKNCALRGFSSRKGRFLCRMCSSKCNENLSTKHLAP